MSPPSTPSRLHLVRDVLDTALKDRADEPLGRADRIILSLHDGAPPQVAWIETGGTALAGRLNRRFGRAVQRFGRRFGLRRGGTTRFRWLQIKSMGADIHVDVDKDRSPASLWERWLLQHIIRWIPGIKRP